MKKGFMRFVASILAICLMISCAMITAWGEGNAERDEAGGVWDFDNGVYYAPDGSVHQIVSGEAALAVGSIYEDDGQVYISEEDSPCVVEDDIIVGQVDNYMSAVNVRSGSYGEGEEPAGDTSAHFEGNIYAGLKQAEDNKEWFVSGTALDVNSQGGTVDVIADKSILLDVEKTADEAQSVANGVNISSSKDGTATVTIKDDISVVSDGFSTGMNFRNGSYHGSKDNGTIDATVNGDIIAVGDRGARGIYEAQTNFTDGNNGKVNWSAVVEGKIDLVSGTEEATGVSVIINNGTSNVAVKKGIYANSSDAYAAGLNAMLEGDSKLMFSVNDGISLRGESSSSAANVFTQDNSSAELSISGDTSVSVKNGSALGYTLSSYDKSMIAVDIQGDIGVNGRTETNAIVVGAYDDSQVSLSVKGNIDSTSADQGVPTVAVLEAYDSADIQASIVGDVKATNVAEEPVSALLLKGRGEESSISFDLTGNVDAVSEKQNAEMSILALGIENYGGKIDATIHGNISSDGLAITIDDTMGLIAGENEAETVLKVIDGDVHGEAYGMYIEHENPDSKIDVLIDGTLSGDKAAIVLTEESVLEDFTLTVWEIKSDDKTNLVTREAFDPETGKSKLSEDAEVAKTIQYIIKIDPTQTDIITADGTTKYEGYDVAHEGDTVTMKLNIPAGYEIAGAYGDADQAVQLLKGADGNYYLVVPRGGGVMLSVKMRKIASAKLTRAVVSIDLNGGTLNGKTEGFEMKGWLEKKFKMPGTPTKEGCTFLGWYATEVARTDPGWKAPTEGSSELIVGDGEIDLSGNTYVTAIWNEN